MEDMYREVILDHYKNPRFKGELDPADISYQDDNPLCGDMIRIDLRVDENNRVVECAFSGQGCAISQASASMLMEDIQGKSLEEIKEYSRDEIKLIRFFGISQFIRMAPFKLIIDENKAKLFYILACSLYFENNFYD